MCSQRWPFVDLCTFFAWQAPEIGHRWEDQNLLFDRRKASGWIKILEDPLLSSTRYPWDLGLDLVGILDLQSILVRRSYRDEGEILWEILHDPSMQILKISCWNCLCASPCGMHSLGFWCKTLGGFMKVVLWRSCDVFIEVLVSRSWSRVCKGPCRRSCRDPGEIFWGVLPWRSLLEVLVCKLLLGSLRRFLFQGHVRCPTRALAWRFCMIWWDSCRGSGSHVVVALFGVSCRSVQCRVLKGWLSEHVRTLRLVNTAGKWRLASSRCWVWHESSCSCMPYIDRHCTASQQHAVMQGALKASGWCGLHECDLNAEGLKDFLRHSQRVVCFDCSAICLLFALRSNGSMKALQHIIANYLPRMLDTLHLELRRQGVTQILRDTQCFERLEHGPILSNLWHVSC